MRIFESLYQKVYHWSSHRYAPQYLVAVSFVESSFFPIPPYVMLVPMVWARPDKAYWYAFIATLASVLGGILGYFIGAIAFESIVNPFLTMMGYKEKYGLILEWFQHWGGWAVFLSCFSPIPYKFFTIGAGVLNISFWQFLLGSLVGRSFRFFFVTWAIRYFGENLNVLLKKNIEWIGWFLVVIVLSYAGYSLI